jgi:DNA polymerase III delta prime subunit
MPDISKVRNPFNEVSVYPPLLPYVGQEEAHDRLAEFISEMNQGLESVFFAVYGDWAIGKSRLAHELISEVCGEDRGWMLKDSAMETNRLLGPINKKGILPLFIPYSRVLNFESFGITSADVLGKIITTAFLQVAEPTGLNKTQMDVIERVQNIILTLNPDFDFSRLALTAQDREMNYITRANKLFQILKNNTSSNGNFAIRKLMILVDEVESAGEVNPFSVQGADRVISLHE